MWVHLIFCAIDFMKKTTLIGFDDLGDPGIHFSTLNEPDELATHVYVIILRNRSGVQKSSFINYGNVFNGSCSHRRQL